MADLVLEGVTKSYGPVTVVPALDLTLRAGEFVTLLGPSGCGKTTTLKMVGGIELPDRGRILLGGRDISRLPASARGIGFVFQNLALFPHRTVAENVAFGLRMRGVPGPEILKRTLAALDMVHLGAHRDKLPAALSGGQQQRVALARAFVIEPPVMLLDEPLSALDRNLREEMQLEIRDLTRRLGITTIFVTHDQAEAMAMSDRIAVMERGRVAQFDRPDVLYAAPASPFVAGFMGVANLRPGRVLPGGQVLLDGAAGTTIATATDLPAGTAVTLGLRPEAAVRVAEGGHLFRVNRAVFQGTHSLVGIERLDAAGQPMGERFEASLANDSQPVRDGDHLRLSWPADKVLVYPRG